MIKVIYKNANNISTEASVYTSSEFVSSFSGSGIKPVTTNSSGIIDSSLLPGVPASSVQIVRKATVPIQRGDCVKADNDTHVSPAFFNGTYGDATVIGVASNSALVGEDVTIVIMGVIVDSIFNIFPVNTQLFLDIDGAMTDGRVLSGFSTLVAKSLGNGSIFITVREPQRMS